MTKRLSILSILVFCSIFCITCGLMAEDQKNGWAANFELFRSHFKSLPQSEVVYCEKLLREILHDLDTKNQCNGDADCGLIDQDPFGATVPFPKNHLASMKAKMKEYCEHCDDGFSHSVRNDDLINKPVCVDGECMVSTSFKEQSRR